MIRGRAPEAARPPCSKAMRAGFGSNDDSAAQTYSASESETRQVAKDGIAGTKSLDAAARGDHASGAAS